MEFNPQLQLAGLLEWMHTQLEACHGRTAVIGISGGLDSCLALLVAVHAMKKLNRPMDLWPGFCPTHNRIMPEQIEKARAAHPGAPVIVHPECPPATADLADQALSTGGMLKFVRESQEREFIIGTETGILHRMRKENPDKVFYPLEPEPLCPNMKKITLEDVLFALQDMKPQIELDADTIARARAPIDRMLQF